MHNTAELSDENPKDNYLNILSRLRYLNPLSEVGIVNAFSKADLRQIIVRHGLGRLIKPDDPKQKYAATIIRLLSSGRMSTHNSHISDKAILANDPRICPIRPENSVLLHHSGTSTVLGAAKQNKGSLSDLDGMLVNKRQNNLQLPVKSPISLRVHGANTTGISIGIAASDRMLKLDEKCSEAAIPKPVSSPHPIDEQISVHSGLAVFNITNVHHKNPIAPSPLGTRGIGMSESWRDRSLDAVRHVRKTDLTSNFIPVANLDDGAHYVDSDDVSVCLSDSESGSDSETDLATHWNRTLQHAIRYSDALPHILPYEGNRSQSDFATRCPKDFQSHSSASNNACSSQSAVYSLERHGDAVFDDNVTASLGRHMGTPMAEMNERTVQDSTQADTNRLNNPKASSGVPVAPFQILKRVRIDTENVIADAMKAYNQKKKSRYRYSR